FSVSGKVDAVALAWDGRRAAVGMANGPVQIRDAHSGRALRVLRGAGPARSLSFSRDGRAIAIVGADRRAHLWDLSTAKQNHAFGSKVSAVGFSPDGRLL